MCQTLRLRSGSSGYSEIKKLPVGMTSAVFSRTGRTFIVCFFNLQGSHVAEGNRGRQLFVVFHQILKRCRFFSVIVSRCRRDGVDALKYFGTCQTVLYIRSGLHVPKRVLTVLIIT